MDNGIILTDYLVKILPHGRSEEPFPYSNAWISSMGTVSNETK